MHNKVVPHNKHTTIVYACPSSSRSTQGSRTFDLGFKNWCMEWGSRTDVGPGILELWVWGFLESGEGPDVPKVWCKSQGHDARPPH